MPHNDEFLNALTNNERLALNKQTRDLANYLRYSIPYHDKCRDEKNFINSIFSRLHTLSGYQEIKSDLDPFAVNLAEQFASSDTEVISLTGTEDPEEYIGSARKYAMEWEIKTANGDYFNFIVDIKEQGEGPYVSDFRFRADSTENHLKGNIIMSAENEYNKSIKQFTYFMIDLVESENIMDRIGRDHVRYMQPKVNTSLLNTLRTSLNTSVEGALIAISKGDVTAFENLLDKHYHETGVRIKCDKDIHNADLHENAFDDSAPVIQTKSPFKIYVRHLKAITVYQKSPLTKEHISGIERLSTLGFDIDEVFDDGDTILHYCVQSKATPEVIELLLKNGADTGLVNKSGETPLDLAKKMEYKTIAAVFEASMIKQTVKNSRHADSSAHGL